MNSMRSNATIVLLVVIVLSGFFFRLGAVQNSKVDKPIRADAGQYTAYAYNVKLHGIYSHQISTIANPDTRPTPDAYRPPGYPMFLYLFTKSRSLGEFVDSITHTQAILSTLSIIFVYLIAAPLLGRIGALTATLLTALSPHLINMNIYLLTETLFTFVLLVIFTVASRRTETNSLITWAIVGVLIGFAALIKPTLQYYAVFMAVFIALSGKIKKPGRAGIILFAGFISVFSIWLIRNAVVMDSLSDPTLTIRTLQSGMYPELMFENRPETVGMGYKFDPDNEVIASSLNNVISAIIRHITEEPVKYLGWYLSKPLFFFQWNIVNGMGDIFIYPTLSSPYFSEAIYKGEHQLMHTLHNTLIYLSLVGCLLAWIPGRISRLDEKQAFVARLISTVYIYFILVHTAGTPLPRYSIPIRPISYILAVLPIVITVSLLKVKFTNINSNVAVQEKN